MAVYKSVVELIGNTPLVELSNLEKKLNLKAKILAKFEAMNPSGSVKDRAHDKRCFRFRQNQQRN